MNYISRLFQRIAWTLLFLAIPLMAQKGPKDKFEFTKLNKIKLPKVHKVVLPNGLELLLVEDKDYPTIDLRALIRTGSIHEDADKTGLAGITGEVMRSGGSKKFPGDALDATLETLAATVETSIGISSGRATISVLKEDIDKGLEVLADLLMFPQFPQDKIDLIKVQARSGISRRNDNVAAIANREFDKLIYGTHSPHARHIEYATIDAITRQDLVDFHATFFHPNNITMAVWGDFNWKEMKKKISMTFSGWAKGPAAPKTAATVKYTFDSSVNYIEKTDVNQSNILLGHIGGTQDNPDYPALTIMNQILSKDRLFKRVRTDEGLAYSVYGNYGAGFKVPGIFTCGCQTKSESTVKAIKIILEEIRLMQNSQVTEHELQNAKNSYLNSYVFNFQTKGQIINRLLRLAYFGYPADFMDTIKAGVEEVSRADVQSVAKKYLKPDDMRILVVGNSANFDEPLSTLGKVNNIDISIPKPKGEELQQANGASLARGMSILKAARKELGGDNIAAVKTMLTNANISMMGMNLKATSWITFPDLMRTDMQTPMGTVKIVVTPESGWQIVPGRGEMIMPATELKKHQETLLRDLLYVLADPSKKTVQFLEETEIDGKKVADLLITENDHSFHLLIDLSSSRPWGMKFQGETQQGPAELIEQFLEYKQFDNIWLPMKVITTVQGNPMAETTRESIEINLIIPDDTYSK
ncbi:insulinase family protein [bacterium]|nr:insulinase family protein [bacterium]